MTAFIRKHAAPLALLGVLSLLAAAPYLIPTDPDSAVFRSGTLGLALLCAAFIPVRRAFARSDGRSLLYGCAFAWVFAFCLGLGCELAFYGQLLPGMGSLIRRLAVPILATPVLGAFASALFALIPAEDGRRLRLPFGGVFLLLTLCYGAVLLALYPGVVSYDFAHEMRQFTTGVYEAAHPVFHTLFLGSLYALGEAVFGSMTAGAALYSAVQLLLLAAMLAWVCAFAARRIPPFVSLALVAFFALLPFHGVLAVSTAKDPLFSGLCAVLCALLWSVAEDPDAFLRSRFQKARFAACCLLMALLRHNGVFAFLPALLSLLALCRSSLRRAALFAAAALLLCVGVPKGLETMLGAQELPGSEMMSIPCQQLMRTGAQGGVTQEEREEISAWFSDALHRYRPHCADPAKGGNFDFARYQRNPRAFWSMYARYALNYPRVYLEAFLENCAGMWAPGDTSHAHSLSNEQNEYIYLNTVYPFGEGEYDIKARSLLPPLTRLLYRTMHKSKHESIPFLAALYCPATYSFTLLLATLLLAKRRRGRWALCLTPLWGIFVSVLFAAGVFIRYAYPLMVGVPVMLALVLFAAPEKAA